MTQKLHIKTWGCQMNEYDSSKMADLLLNTHGLELTDIPEEADVLLLNTCSIREKAQEKVFHQLGRWKELKKQNPNLVIGVGGCVASQEGEHIRHRAPYVDIVFGPQTLHRLPEMINQIRGGKSSVVDVSFPEIEKFDRLPEPRAEGPTAFVSIMEGCNKYCTYCVVPYTRGEEVSRPVDDVLFEIAQLAEQGVREINLLGQNVNAYRGPTFDGGICTFAELLRLVASIDGIDRLRFTTSHPIEFTDDIIDVYRDTPELVDFVHLPVQAGSDRILTMMKRGHTALEYKSIIRKLRAVRPNIQISSDFIVGFPGETEEDFQMLLDFLKEAQLDRVGCFKFSPVEGAPATEMADQVPEDIKEERFHRFMQLQQEISAERLKQKIGQTLDVIVDEIDDEGIIGRTKADAPEVDGLVYIENLSGTPVKVGEFIKVTITHSDEYDLWGTC